MESYPCALRTSIGRPSRRRPIFAAVALAVAFVSAPAWAFGLRWEVAAGSGVPTEMGPYVGLSPRAGGTLTTWLTDATHVGLLGDFVSYATKQAGTSGDQWRALVVVKWEIARRYTPEWLRPYGEFGLGFGELRYVGLTQTEAIPAPAARVGLGTYIRFNRRFGASVLISLDRLDAAANGLDRLYPTTVGLSLGFSADWPAGGPLFREPPEPGR